MSRIPYYLSNLRNKPFGMGGKVLDGLFYDGLTNVYGG